jgi:hypothetical protein
MLCQGIVGGIVLVH